MLHGGQRVLISTAIAGGVVVFCVDGVAGSGHPRADASRGRLARSDAIAVSVDAMGLPASADPLQAELVRHGFQRYARKEGGASNVGSGSSVWSSNFLRYGFNSTGAEALADMFGQKPKSSITDIFSTTRGPSSTRAASDDVDVAKTMRLRLNGVGDTETLVGAFSSVCALSIPLLFAFSFLRSKYPVIYANRHFTAAVDQAAETGATSSCPSQADGDDHHVFAEDITNRVSMDARMHVEFHTVALRIITCLLVVVPTVLCPLHWRALDGGETRDLLTRLSLPTREDRPGIEAVWVHAVMVWVVVFVTVWNLFAAQEQFLPSRFGWLRRLPYPQANTILVQNIPEAYRSDEQLKRYFGSLYSEDLVRRAYVVRKTSRLLQLGDDLNKVTEALTQVVARPVRELGQRVGDWVDSDRSPTRRAPAEQVIWGHAAESPRLQEGDAAEAGSRAASTLGSRPNLLRTKSELETALANERQQMAQPHKCASSGFVTFNSRKTARQASNEPSISVDGMFLVQPAPDPADVLYASLEEEPSYLTWAAGWLSILGLFVAFTPLVVAVTATLSLDSMSTFLPALAKLGARMPKLHAMLEGVIASFALSMLMSIMPSIFRFVVIRFFRPTAGAYADLSVERLSFVFQFVFVLLGVALGQGLTTTLAIVADHPVAVLPLLGRTMPLVSHFYLSYMAVGCLNSLLELLRPGPMLRFMTIPDTRNTREVLAKCEKFNTSMGQRVAKSAILLDIPLVFCSLCPPLLLVAWVYFAIGRTVYRYLYQHAEMKRADLGGAYFVHSLHQVFTGLALYATLMFSVICVHCRGDVGPPMLVAPAIPAVFCFWYRFRLCCQWEVLPLDQTASLDDEVPSTADRAVAPEHIEYEQPECREAQLQPEETAPTDSLEER